MEGKVLVDSGILIAAYERTQAERQEQALQLLDHLVKTGTGVVSPQVLAEFFVAVTEKISVPLGLLEACDRMQRYQQLLTVVDLTPAMALDAARGVRLYQLNFWDAQIWATARLSQICVVCTDTAPAGSMIEGIRFLNPFSKTFQLGNLP